MKATRLVRRFLCCAMLAAFACQAPQSDRERPARFEFERAQMGTLFRVVLYAPTRDVAQTAADAAFARLDELNSRLSDYDPQSELSKLSSASDGEVPTPWISVSNELAAVLARAAEISAASDGAFDVSCGAATRLWRRAIREGEMPPSESLAHARESIDWRAVDLSLATHRVRLTRRGMRLDLGGIAKGYALDQMLIRLAECGVRSALVDGGGDVAVGEAPPGERGWRIELGAVTQAQSGPRQALLLRHAAVATSGDLFRSVLLDGSRYSHIVDPHTGMGLTTQCGASVVAGDGMTADALATAATVLGPKDSARLWARFETCDFRVIAQTASGLLLHDSPRFSRLIAP